MTIHFSNKLLEKYGNKSRPNEQFGTLSTRMDVRSISTSTGLVCVGLSPCESVSEDVVWMLTARNLKRPMAKLPSTNLQSIPSLTLQTSTESLTVRHAAESSSTTTDVNSAVIIYKHGNFMTVLAAAVVNKYTRQPEAQTCLGPIRQVTHISMEHIQIASMPGSSPVPRPSDISHFLKHAKKRLGVVNAHAYKGTFKHYYYRPDILHRVPNEKLTEIGVPFGDVICLKEGCQAWWNGPNAKKSQDNNGNSGDGNDNLNLDLESRRPKCAVQNCLSRQRGHQPLH